MVPLDPLSKRVTGPLRPGPDFDALNERRASLVGKGIVQPRDELRRGLGNLRVAAERALATRAEYEARGPLAGLNEFFFAHSWFDGAETCERLAAVASDASGRGDQVDRASPVALTGVAYRTCLVSRLGYDEELDRLALECLPGLRDSRMTHELDWRLLALGINAYYRDISPDAAGYLQEAVATARSAGDQLGEAGSFSWLGFVQLLLGDNEGARSSFKAWRAAAKRPRNPQMLAYALSKLGILADAEERYAEAMALHVEANELFTAVGTPAAPPTR